MTDPMATPFNPLDYADNGTFRLAVAYTQGSGIPTDPIIPEENEGGGGEYLWLSSMVEHQDGFWTTPDGIAQVISYAPPAGTQMQCHSGRGDNELDETWLTWVWNTIDIHGMFADDTVDFKSFMTAGQLMIHALFAMP